MFIFRWRCKDRRYNIRFKGDNTTHLYISATCGWYNTFDINPSDLECVLLYCDNATDLPFVNEIGYERIQIPLGNIVTGVYDTNNPTLIPIDGIVTYVCKASHAHHADTDWLSQAPQYVNSICSENGTFEYPEPWPECFKYDNLFCPDPGTKDDLIRTEVDFQHTADNYTYKSEFQYICVDKRRFLKVDQSDAALTYNIISICRWKQTYDILGPSLVCEIHHCAHPHDDDGAHPPPDPKYNISLVESTEVLASHVPFDEKIMYKCDDNTFIENNERDPTQNNITVTCLNTGLYDVPAWPNCTETVSCGPPPEAPVNGSRIWLNGTEDQVF